MARDPVAPESGPLRMLGECVAPAFDIPATLKGCAYEWENGVRSRFGSSFVWGPGEP